MTQIINIRKHIISGHEVQTVNARELHAFLGSGQHFSNWIAQRVEQYGFVEGQDFLIVLLESSGGRPARDYYISVDMAKELSMVERNEKGKQARQYFIECERRARSAVANLPDFTNPAEAARAWADEVEAKQAAVLQLEQAKPAIQFVDRYVDGSGLKGFRQVCKLLSANESRFREFLCDAKVMYRLAGEWVPYQPHIEAGRFVVKTGTSSTNGRIFNEAKFTPKGIKWIAGEWAKHQIQAEVA